MHHLLHNAHVAGPLHDFLPIAVDYRENRARNAASDAADVIAEVFPRIGLGIVIAGSFGSRPEFGFREHLRYAAILWIHHKRGLFAWTTRTLAPMSRRPCADACIRSYR